MIKVAQVMNEEGGAMAYEITLPDGEVFFYEHSQEHWSGLRVGKFPSGAKGEYVRVVLWQHDVAANVATDGKNTDEEGAAAARGDVNE